VAAGGEGRSGVVVCFHYFAADESLQGERGEHVEAEASIEVRGLALGE